MEDELLLSIYSNGREVWAVNNGQTLATVDVGQHREGLRAAQMEAAAKAAKQAAQVTSAVARIVHQ
jgi:hypothetical protein